MLRGIWNAFRRLLIYAGIVAERATDNDAINIAIVERGIRDKKTAIDEALTMNGKLKGAISLLKEQVLRQRDRKTELLAMLEVAANKNDEKNGSRFAEQLADLDGDLKENEAQLKGLEAAYEQNTANMAEAKRAIQKHELDFQRIQAKAASSKQMMGVADLIRSTNETLQGVFGGEVGKAMDSLRKSSAEGQGQIDATTDLASKLGSDVSFKQAEREARGTALFKEFQRKAAMGKDPQLAQVASATPSGTPSAERQRVEA